MLSWISKIIKGIVIALGFILPGISGGVLAAILGIYERNKKASRSNILLAE